MYARALLSRYISNGRPLSGHFAICSVMEIQCTVLAQILSPPALQSPASSSSGPSNRTGFYPAQASTTSWISLTSNSVNNTSLGTEEAFRSAIMTSLTSSMQCCTDLLEQIEDIGDINPEIYAYETLSKSLVSVFFCSCSLCQYRTQKLATLCSLALHEVHAPLLDRLRLLLSDRTPIAETELQDSVVKCVAVIVRK